MWSPRFRICARDERGQDSWITMPAPVVGSKGGRTTFSTEFATSGVYFPGGKARVTVHRGHGYSYGIGPPAPAEKTVAEFETSTPVPTIAASADAGESKDYAALPETQWIQLNPATDQYTLQLKLQKIPRADLRRATPDADRVDVYTVVRCILHETPTDRDRVLAL